MKEYWNLRHLDLFSDLQLTTLEQVLRIITVRHVERGDVALEIVSIADQPEQVVRLGITHTPALVMDDEVLAYKVSVDSLTEILRTRLHGPGASPQPVG